MQVEREIESDVLVIGGGMAGLFAAIKAKEEGSEVVLVDKNYVSRSGSTCFAEGDYSVFSTEWGHDLASWLDRVRVSGEYLNDPEWTEITLKDSIERYRDLLRMGVRAKEKEGGDILTYTRPGFGPLECCFLGRGWTFLPALRREASKRGVTIVDRVMVTDLILEDGVVAGACGFHTRTAEFYVFPAKAVVLCTGNGTFDMAGAMAPVSFLSYDGIAMAYRAGAEIGGMEFSCVGAAAFVAERDEKARIDVSGRTIHMAPAHYPAWVSYGPHISFNLDNYVDAEGFRVSRLTAPHAIHEGRGPILWVLDAARPEDLEATLRDIRDSRTTFRLERVGIDLAKGGVYAGVLRLESTPGHLIFGGGAGVVSKDKACATSLPGLYAGGDTCYTRAVGASYPAFGFGLRNASVTGARAGKAAALFSWKRGRISIDKERLRRVREYVYGPLAMAMKEGHWFLLDEIDLLDPATAAGLNGIVEGRPLTIPEKGGEVIKPASGFRFIATANTAGSGDRSGLYQGTLRQNGAFLDRFWMVEVDYPDEIQEKQILAKAMPSLADTVRDALVSYANEIRKLFIKGEIEVTFSTRTLVRWAKLVYLFRPASTEGKNPIIHALDRALGYRAEPESREALHELAQRVFGG